MAKARILAVDDQLYCRGFLEDLLQQEGYDVSTASGGEEALHLLERESFDVILTDLVMPGMDGSELVQRIKKEAAGPEIIDGLGFTGRRCSRSRNRRAVQRFALKYLLRL